MWLLRIGRFGEEGKSLAAANRTQHYLTHILVTVMLVSLLLRRSVSWCCTAAVSDVTLYTDLLALTTCGPHSCHPCSVCSPNEVQTVVKAMFNSFP